MTVVVTVNAMRESIRLVEQQVAQVVLRDLLVQIRQVITRSNANLEPFQLASKQRVHHVQQARKLTYYFFIMPIYTTQHDKSHVIP